MMKTYGLMSLAAMMLSCTIAIAETEEIELKGEYAQIDTRRDILVIAALLSGSKNEQAQVAHDVIEDAGQYCPAVFFPLAIYLFGQGKTDDAIFWMYAGRIRCRYDIRRCTDETVQDAVDVMNQQLPDLLRLIQFENIKKAKAIMEKAIEWDRTTPHDYDPRWIALHGVGASLPDAGKKEPGSLTVTRDVWDAIAEANRREYLSTFLEDLESFTPEQMEQIKVRIKELKEASLRNKSR